MSRIRLIHWNAHEAEERAKQLRTAGYRVDYAQFDFPRFFRKLREDPPAAVVVDLSRLPSQGRDATMAIRSYKATRQLPILFVDGDPKKVAQIKTQLPDVVYTS